MSREFLVPLLLIGASISAKVSHYMARNQAIAAFLLFGITWTFGCAGALMDAPRSILHLIERPSLVMVPACVILAYSFAAVIIVGAVDWIMYYVLYVIVRLGRRYVLHQRDPQQ